MFFICSMKLFKKAFSKKDHLHGKAVKSREQNWIQSTKFVNQTSVAHGEKKIRPHTQNNNGFVFWVQACKSLQSCLFATLWTEARQAPLSMGFSRQECWSALPFPSPGDLPDPGIEPTSLTPPALAGRFFTTSPTWIWGLNM